MHVYEVRFRKDRSGADLISAVLPFGRVCYGGTNAISNAIGYAEHFSRSHDCCDSGLRPRRQRDRNAQGTSAILRSGDLKSVDVARLLKTLAGSVGAWWGIMSGAVSIPFAFLALFDIPGRLLFAALAYVSLWVLIAAQAKRILELQKPVRSPNVRIQVDKDLIDSRRDPHWIRGEIKNCGDRAAEGCRLKVLSVEGQNVVQAEAIENGELEWQGGGCGPKRLDPDERWIFDIGTRARADNSALVLLAFFGVNQVGCALPSPGVYKVTFGLFGPDIPSEQKSVTFTIGRAVDDIQIL
jgi:hypothetical protein